MTDTKEKDIKELRFDINNLVYKLWVLLPEPKETYTHYYQQVEEVLDNREMPVNSEKVEELNGVLDGWKET